MRPTNERGDARDRHHGRFRPARAPGQVRRASSARFTSFAATRSSTRTSALGDLTERREAPQRASSFRAARASRRPSARPGELKRMAGDVDQPDVSTRTARCCRARIVTGNTSLRIAGEKGAPGAYARARRIVEIGMAPDGATLTSLTARDQVVLDLPGRKDSRRRACGQIALVASGDARQRIDGRDFTRRCRVCETGGTPPVKRIVTSRSLDTDAQRRSRRHSRGAIHGERAAADGNGGTRRQCRQHALPGADRDRSS